MKKIFFLGMLFFCLALGAVFPFSNLPSGPSGSAGAIGPFQKDDRVLILAPHPDDEAIGCAGVIQQAHQAGAKVTVAYLTNGDHNQWAFIVYEKRLTIRKGEFVHMGEVRRSEAVKAMKLLGLEEGDLIFLGYPDYGTLAIFTQYWQTRRPFRDFLTRISSVPYKKNLSYGAPYTGESILGDLKKVIILCRPNKIFVSHPADVNRDHKALYLFLQVALNDLEKLIPKPELYPYLIHCLGWPLPRHYHPDLNLEPPRQFLHSDVSWLRLGLTPEQLDKKHKAILCYKSQTESSAFYLLSFGRRNELFGDYPPVQLKEQVSLKEKAVQFLGFSGMYPASDAEDLTDEDIFSREEGEVGYAVLDRSLLIRIKRTKEVSRKLSLMIYLFGYNRNVRFETMPKIRIMTRYNKLRVFEGRKMIRDAGVSLRLNSDVFVLKVPLNLLGDPDFILASIKAHGGKFPFDTTGFRRIEIIK